MASNGKQSLKVEERVIAWLITKDTEEGRRHETVMCFFVGEK